MEKALENLVNITDGIMKKAIVGVVTCQSRIKNQKKKKGIEEDQWESIKK